jgi:general stress protein 26
MDLADKIFEVIRGVNIAAVATLGSVMYPVPRVRYMITVGYPDLTLKAATRKNSPKISQIKDVPKACVAIWSGKSLEEITKPYVIMDTNVEIIEDERLKRKFWNPVFENFLSGMDSEYVILEFKPYSIEYWENGKMEKWTTCEL